MTTKIDGFKSELKALLKKYDMTIGGAYEGDTYGIESETFEAMDDTTFKTYVLNMNSSWIDYTDL